jgi:6-O-methylguanine DNA methyltransferase, ribonuclease-like domain
MKFNKNTVQTRWASPLGTLILAASDAGLCGLWFDDQRHLPDTTVWPLAAHPLLEATKTQLSQYFAGQRTQFDLPLDAPPATARSAATWATPKPCARSAQPWAATRSASSCPATACWGQTARSPGMQAVCRARRRC